MVLVFGESLIDVFAGAATGPGPARDERVGGSPFNVAIGLASRQLSRVSGYLRLVSPRSLSALADAVGAALGGDQILSDQRSLPDW